jgi:peptidoglycan hydrolase-like protein with peptidoglycan-binding domain
MALHERSGVPGISLKQIGGSYMKIVGVSLMSAILFITPLVAVAAGERSVRGEVPPGVDQMLSQDIVLLAESHLRAAGFDPGPIDGLFDAKTEAATFAYQQKHGLPRTGVLDRATRTALLKDDGGDS